MSKKEAVFYLLCLLLIFIVWAAKQESASSLFSELDSGKTETIEAATGQ